MKTETVAAKAAIADRFVLPKLRIRPAYTRRSERAAQLPARSSHFAVRVPSMKRSYAAAVLQRAAGFMDGSGVSLGAHAPHAHALVERGGRPSSCPVRRER